MSWKPEVIADATGKWCGNALRFATREEALDNVRALEWSWLAVRQTRVVECDDPVTHAWVDGRLQDAPGRWAKPAIEGGNDNAL